MKLYKKIGLGLVLGLLTTVTLVAPAANQALAATAPSGVVHNFGVIDPFGGVSYTLQNGKITTTIRLDQLGNSQTVTFTNTTAKPLVYTGDAKIFCTSQGTTSPVSAPVITLTSTPSGKTVSGKMSVEYFTNGSCNTRDNGDISITNQDTSTGGSGSTVPNSLTYNSNTYVLIDPSYPATPLYGLSTDGGSCYGGSIIATDAKGTNGTAYLDLTTLGQGGSPSLASALGNIGNANSLIANCGFKSGANTTGYAGSIANGKLNAATPDPTSTTASNDTSACVFQTNQTGLDTALSWILCPVINGLSQSADAVNGFVESQLNFSVNENLGSQVMRAWATFKNLASAAVVIVLLVMVISQAVGGGPFDAYTVRKLLPRLVIGVILMQVSWYICVYAIGLANDAGQGVAELMAAPFGGLGALDLPSLLRNVSSTAAAVVGIGSTAGIITALVFAGPILAFGWPILILALILITLAVVVAIATLLFRNALIVLLVMLSPLAILAWLMPGTDKYWKMWKDNFIRLLVFFPLVMALIYAGRIFAWTVGNLGTPGPLDVIMVIVGFFGPYFLLPKSFKWGGDWLSSASRAVGESWPVKKGREAANKELLTNDESAMKRRMGHYASEYTDQDSRGTRIKNSLLSGRFIPSRRSKAAMIAKGNAFKSKEGELEKAVQERRREKAASRSGNVMAGKQMDLDAISESSEKAAKAAAEGDTFKQKANERTAKEAMRDLIATGSTLELNREQITDTDGKKKYVWQTKMWADLLNGSPELYARVKGDAPDWVPHRTPVGLPGYRGEYTTIAEAGDSSDEARQRQKLAAAGKSPAEINQEIAKNIETAQFRRTANGHTEYVDDVQWASSLLTTVEELDAGGIAKVHPTYFERIGDAAAKGHKIVQEAQASGDVELEEVGNALLKPAQEFGRTIATLANSSGGRQQLDALKGGADTMEHLDYALQFSGTTGSIEATRKGTGSLEGVLKQGERNEAERLHEVRSNIGQQQAAPEPVLVTGGTQQAAMQPQVIAPTTGPQQQAQQVVAGTPVAGEQRFGGAPAGAPVVLQIDHDALAETISSAARRGVRQGFREARGAGTPVQNINIEGTTPGGVDLPQGVRDDRPSENPPAPPNPTPPGGGE